MGLLFKDALSLCTKPCWHFCVRAGGQADPTQPHQLHPCWHLLLIFKPHAMMMNKLIYFLPLLNIRTNKE